MTTILEVTPQKQPRQDFYTYRLIRSDTGLPFYVGKGCKARIEAHETNARKHSDCNHRVCNTIRKLWREGYEVIKEKIADNITEKSAFILEKLYVSLGSIYGWNLVNHTDGGEGVSGYRWTEEQRIMRREVALREIALHPERHARFQEGRINRFASPEEIQKRTEKVSKAWSDKTKRKEKGEVTKALWQDEDFRAKQMGRFEDPDVCKSMGDHIRGKHYDALAKTYPGFISPDGITYENVFNLHTFCQEHDLQISNMCEVASGKQYAHKGWRAYPLREEPVRKPSPPKIPYTGFVNPDGQVFQVTSTLKAFCQEHGLTLGAMSNVNAGKWPSHKGWTKYNP
jgi:hypothetical protein